MLLSFFRYLKYLPKRLVRVILITSIRLIPKSFKTKTSMTFASELADDGTGAQIQRLIGVRALALLLRIPYSHTPIEKVAIHPFDPFKTMEEMHIFVDRVNTHFRFKSYLHNV